MTKQQATKKQNAILKLFFSSERRRPAQVIKTTYKNDYSEMNFQIMEMTRHNGKEEFFAVGPTRNFEEMKTYLQPWKQF